MCIRDRIYPETIKTPQVVNGKRDQSLSNVFMNNFAKDESIIWHQADGDVKATAKLLHKIKLEQPDYWATRTKMFSKFTRYKIFSDKVKFATYYFPKQKITEFVPVVDIDTDNLDSKYNYKKIIDLDGQTIIPGIIDSHCHFYNLGLDQQVVDLRETKSFDEIIQRLKNYELNNDTDVIMGRGWDQNDWDKKSFPVNTKLNEEFKNKLVVLERIDGHAYIVNDNVLELSGINKNTLVRGGLVLLKDDKPTGVLIDGPMSLVDQVLPEKTLNEKINALKRAEEICFSYGLTTVDDAGLSTNITSIIDSLHKSNDLKIKIYAMISVSRKNIEKFKKEGRYKSKKLNIRSFKVYGDGALGSRGAVLKNPYCDDPHNYGILRTSADDLKYYAKEIAEMGFQMNTHAIGDSTVSVLLNEYKKVLSEIDDPRWRIEHSQVVDMNEFELYNDKILPSIQPTHATSDMYWAYDRLGLSLIHI